MATGAVIIDHVNLVKDVVPEIVAALFGLLAFALGRVSGFGARSRRQVQLERDLAMFNQLPDGALKNELSSVIEMSVRDELASRQKLRSRLTFWDVTWVVIGALVYVTLTLATVAWSQWVWSDASLFSAWDRTQAVVALVLVFGVPIAGGATWGKWRRFLGR